jgi:nucleotide-binding universal stress UspA family protein
MKKILVPVDSSEYSKKGVEVAKKFAAAFDSDVVLLYVVSLKISAYWYDTTIPQPELLDSIVEAEKVYAEELLTNYKNSFEERKERVETLILEGIVVDEIIEYINNNDLDLVIMGSHGIGSALHRTLLGSVTNKVLHYSDKPVLVIK